ncbi:cysteine desulfurase family protein [Methylocapsa sp. S129]|uniref:cysteine desulfurase family protein n=1 Tax=Methylocapsa sp. S129 TaxID=1641869 RepID=UPI001FED571E|nr:cysteine desulfurase family protein [Methylocapsa sp. S129]
MKQTRRSYLDFNATAPLRAEAREACVAAFELAGNPSSIHGEGRAARAVVEQARAAVGELAGVSPRGITFVASGTEAANLVLTPAIAGLRAPLKRLIVSAGEHSCVLKGHRFAPSMVETAPLRDDGRIDLDALAQAVARDDGPVMLALQGANNETGIIQPVAEAAALVHAAGGIVVCDVVQLAGRAPCTAGALGADFLILSAHKLGGPKGAGALVAASPEIGVAEPLLRGGGQERGLRAGTENVAAIAGFGAAARAAMAELADEPARLAKLREGLAAHIARAAPDAVIFGLGVARLSNTLCFAIPGIGAETLMIALDLAGVAVSSGAACSSGKVARSHVLDAMRVDPALGAGAIRLSLGWSSDETDVAHFGEAIAGLASRMRRGRRAA